MKQPINLADKLGTFSEHWSPKIVGSFNGHDLLVVKLKGEFVWHSHPDTDDFFQVLKGRLRIEMRDGDVELGPGEVRNKHYFGRDLVVFRSESGVPHVLEAYCAHMGAHLGVGSGAPSSREPGPGRVFRDCIECPFHGWRYDGTGRCVEIPYSEGRIPENARVRAFPTTEMNGLILGQ